MCLWCVLAGWVFGLGVRFWIPGGLVSSGFCIVVSGFGLSGLGWCG